MSYPNVQDQLGQVLIDFSIHGTFPEEDAVSSAYVDSSTVSAALETLNRAKAELENEVREISRESAPDVDLWIKHAKSIQDDIERSRRLASSIVRQAEADEEKIEVLQEKENYIDFLSKELSFNDQLLAALRSLQAVNESLNKAEQLASEKRIIDGLHMLEDAWKRLGDIPLEKSTRAMRLLDSRSFELRMQIHEQFATIWKELINVKPDHAVITINRVLPGTAMDIDQAIIGLKAYKELDQAAKKFWEDLDDVILKPRTNLSAGSIPSIQVTGNSLSLGAAEVANQTIKSLFIDLEVIIEFLIENLPPDFIRPLADKMMPTLSTRILEVWLDTAVPASLDDMIDYQKALSRVGGFASKLESLNWPGVDTFNDWVTNAPKIWVNKRRDATLDWTRNQLSLGLGTPQPAERVEKRMVARDEGNHITATGTAVRVINPRLAVTQDWDSAWSDDGEIASPQKAESHEQVSNIVTRNRQSLDEERRVSEVFSPLPTPDTDDQADDAADAWGWGDDDDDVLDVEPEAQLAASQVVEVAPPQQHISPPTREMTLSENYWTSSLPRAVYTTVEQVYADGAYLLQPENAHIPVSPAAVGLFNLPRSVLALYRAVSPYYYSLQPGGNMYLYNDAMWLSESFQQFIAAWQNRPDIPRRTLAMVKIESEISVLVSFGKRAYTNELNAQRTIINDLLGGIFFQQDDQIPSELEENIKAVITHIRTTAALWDSILPYSAWASATGSLVNAVASKLITDVFDLSDISVDEAERTATILSRVESLDDLFLPRPQSPNRTKHRISGPDAEAAIPITSQFADKWMKMKFLSEVLQSNLKDVKFLWFESDLSLYFTVDEVVDLVHLSFEKNAAVRQAVKEIRERPNPREEADDGDAT
ncbi:centromere kinetochore protein [Drepanopeziza brunnea f. sp. 'multigermtubi' MB_m1]|uniref:Centromere kinetochore protein n=1 Tax=Marssonina brunnea f. sp. multigermtubi (strain MB_m1) TaxID=1072389 RepID=K1WLK4_MARBU|nr:centromere kinetochore protein [Drepanopeziza brunnea f. sp. 'multigermtubi' MB_m1]EKD13112.1 centromere kinetochore protein [Drepanopeziza brunnea f. sp. 'multigermtubi' MB_m1]